VPPPKLGRILATEGELQPLFAKARELRALAGRVEDFLPPGLARQAGVANFKEGTVVLVARNSPAAAKLKLLAPSLCRFLLDCGWQVNSVSVRVQPTWSQAEVLDARQKTATLSAGALRDLKALHEHLKDSPARSALRRLLERHGALAPDTAAGGARQRKASGSRQGRKPRP
jgi:hypothetical protein